jgi:hypothetical protein
MWKRFHFPGKPVCCFPYVARWLDFLLAFFDPLTLVSDGLLIKFSKPSASSWLSPVLEWGFWWGSTCFRTDVEPLVGARPPDLWSPFVVLGVLGLRGFPQACYSNLKKSQKFFYLLFLYRFNCAPWTSFCWSKRISWTWRFYLEFGSGAGASWRIYGDFQGVGWFSMQS